MTAEDTVTDSSVVSRRKFTLATGGAAVAGIAGCLGGDDEPTTEAGGDGDLDIRVAAAMPAVWDLTRQVGGEHIGTIDDVVPTGEHGHDYSAGVGDLRNIEEADAFVYLRDFAGWIDDFVAEHENGDTVEVIDASADIDFFDSPVEEDDEHWWLDPIAAKAGVDNIVAGLSELDPDHADGYEANGEAFKEDLDDIDAQFQEIVDRAELDTAALGTHNSFGWWVDRYGIEVVSPFGINPDTEASAAKIEEIQNTIEDLGIEYILYDIGEPTTAAESIAAETGAEILPLSPIETQLNGSPDIGFRDGREITMTPEWGYVEHFEEINLPALEIALQAE